MATQSATQPEHTANIRRLPEHVVAQVKSFINITSLVDVVLGLVENALDAQATKIDIAVDFPRGAATVEDNGLGIAPREFEEDAGLGRMYHTAKHNDTHSTRLHGGQGIFLSSLAALSLLTITSKHSRYRSQNAVTFHRSKIIARRVPVPADQEFAPSRHQGTRVSVRDLFGDLPVRVKQRTLLADAPSQFQSQWNDIARGIVAFLLAWPSAIAINVKDATTSVTHCLNSSITRMPDVASTLVQAGYVPQDSMSSFVPASASTLTIFIKGVISTYPAPTKSAQFLSFDIRPCNSQTGHNELYNAINRVFEQSDFGMEDGDLEPDAAEVERRRNDRRYKSNGLTKKRLKGRSKGVDRWPVYYLRIALKNDLLGTSAPVEHSHNNETALKSIVQVLEALSTGWLKAQNFRPRKLRQKRADTSSSTNVRATSGIRDNAASNTVRAPPAASAEACGSETTTLSGHLTQEPALPSIADPRLDNLRGAGSRPASSVNFAGWSRIKSGKTTFYKQLWEVETPFSNGTSSRSATRSFTTAPRVGSLNEETLSLGQYECGVKRPLLGSGLAEPILPNLSEIYDSDMPEDDHLSTWQYTETFHFNTRTGAAILRRPMPRLHGTRRRDSISRSDELYTHPRSVHTRPNNKFGNEMAPSPWFNEFFQAWENPRFAIQAEQSIPKVTTAEPSTNDPGGRHGCTLHAYGESAHGGKTNPSDCLSKAALAKAQVLCQVDQKYILIKVPQVHLSDGSQSLASGNSSLVLVDQHAASERCILEILLSELCKPIAKSQSDDATCTSLGLTSAVACYLLDSPMHYQISSTERTLFERHAPCFARWGISYNFKGSGPESRQPRRNDSGERLTVLTLPSGIKERCIIEPKLVIELLRKEIWAREDSGFHRHHHAEIETDAEESHAWLRSISSCPRSIIELINSRACRSAIMFNDKLSLNECNSLISQLADCAFPFMCAHGRVSLVPLVMLEGSSVGMESGYHGLGGLCEDAMVKSSEGDDFVSAMKHWKEKKSR